MELPSSCSYMSRQTPHTVVCSGVIFGVIFFRWNWSVKPERTGTPALSQELYRCYA